MPDAESVFARSPPSSATASTRSPTGRREVPDRDPDRAGGSALDVRQCLAQERGLVPGLEVLDELERGAGEVVREQVAGSVAVAGLARAEDRSVVLGRPR